MESFFTKGKQAYNGWVFTFCPLDVDHKVLKHVGHIAYNLYFHMLIDRSPQINPKEYMYPE